MVLNRYGKLTTKKCQLEKIEMKVSLNVKLIGLFLLFGLAPLVTVALLANIQAGDALRTKSFDQLESIREIRKGSYIPITSDHFGQRGGYF